MRIREADIGSQENAGSASSTLVRTLIYHLQYVFTPAAVRSARVANMLQRGDVFFQSVLERQRSVRSAKRHLVGRRSSVGYCKTAN